MKPQSVNMNELKRKLIHLGAVSVPLMYVFFDFLSTLIVMSILCIIALIIEAVRLKKQGFNDMFVRWVGPMLRPKEHNAVTAATYMAFSSLISILIFRKPVAILALFFFIAGDAFAAVIGKTFGRTILFDKTLEGSLACLSVCIIIGILLPLLPVWVSLAGAVAVTISELMPMSINDNIRIPLIGGAFMEIFLWLHINLFQQTVIM